MSSPNASALSRAKRLLASIPANDELGWERDDVTSGLLQFAGYIQDVSDTIKAVLDDSAGDLAVPYVEALQCFVVDEAAGDLAEELFGIVKCTRHEDDALEFLTNNYDALRAALTAQAGA